jgi:hypothetical protein
MFRSGEKLGVSFSVYDDKQKLLSEQDLDLSKVKNVENVAVHFGAIKDSKGRKFIFELKPLNERTFKVLTLMTADPLTYESSLFIDGMQLTHRKLLFASFAAPRTMNIDKLMDRMSQNKPRLFKKYPLFFVILAFLASQIYLLICLFSGIFRKTIEKTARKISPSINRKR